jgi:hypothetical protein
MHDFGSDPGADRRRLLVQTPYGDQDQTSNPTRSGLPDRAIERPTTPCDLAASPLDRSDRVPEFRMVADAEVPVSAGDPVKVARLPEPPRQRID